MEKNFYRMSFPSLKFTLFMLILNSVSNNLFAQKNNFDTVTQQLLTIDELDQRYRNQIDDVENRYGKNSPEYDTLFKKMKETDSINLIQVETIINKYGWLGYDEVGSQANTALLMVIQHSNFKTQEKYLPIVREAVKNKKALPGQLALLEDRVALKEGRRQIYGTQIMWINEMNKYAVAPLEDPDNVDIRRAEVGLGPLAKYVMGYDIQWNPAQYKIDLPAIEASWKSSIKH